MTGELLSGVDLAWLRMERASNPMTIVAVLILGERVRYRDVRELIAHRLLRFDRFRELPVADALGTRWQPQRDFDLDAHVVRLRLPRPAGHAALEAAASRLASTQLPADRPLWQIHVIERYQRASAIIARFHHCYADGIALMRVLLSLTDETPQRPQSRSARTRRLNGKTPPDTSPLVAPLTQLLGSAVSAMQRAGQGAADLMGQSLRTLTHPDQAAAMARQITDAGRELASITLLPEEPPTPLKNSLSGRKLVAWSDPLPFMEVKTVAAALGCTINDVLISTAAGAIGAHLLRRGVDIEGLSIRALVPVNLRPLEEEPQLGNEFGLVFATLPVGERNPVTRLYSVHGEMERLKRSTQAVVALWLLTAMGMLPGVVEDRAIELFTSKASVVISNVPGPRKTLYLAGARIEQQYFWVPQAGSIGVGISLLTYDGRVHFGLVADRNLIPAPRTVVRSFAKEFEKLLLYAVSGPFDPLPA